MRPQSDREETTRDDHQRQSSSPAARIAMVLMFPIASWMCWLWIEARRASGSDMSGSVAAIVGDDTGWTGPPSVWQHGADNADAPGELLTHGSPISELHDLLTWVNGACQRSEQLSAQGDINAQVLAQDLDGLETYDPHRPYDRTILHLVGAIDEPQWALRLSRAAFHGNAAAMDSLYKHYGGEILDYGDSGIMFSADSVWRVHTDTAGWSLLHDAVLGGDLTTVEVLAYGLFDPAQPTGEFRGYGQVEASEGQRHASAYHLAALFGDTNVLRTLTPTAYEQMQAERMHLFAAGGDGPYSLRARYQSPDPRPAWQKWGSASRGWRFVSRDVDWGELARPRRSLPEEWQEVAAAEGVAYRVPEIARETAVDDGRGGMWAVRDIAGLTVLDYAKIAGQTDAVAYLEALGIPTALPDGWDHDPMIRDAVARIHETLDQVQRP